MKEFLTAAGTITGVIFLLFFGIILGTVIGGVVGLTVGSAFPFVIDSLNKVSGLTLSSFEMGAVLGFVASFFRPTMSRDK